MKELCWYFPSSMDEVSTLLKKRGVIPYGGGTGILKTGLNRVEGLIDLSCLPIHFFRRDNNDRYNGSSYGRIEIGATQTFAEVTEQLGQGHILGCALGKSASTPLRNRITVGGSMALFPAWSDLMGPLIALEAEVTLAGEQQGTYPITHYLTERGLRKQTLITGISFPDTTWSFQYFRHTRTHFDYPAFTISLLLKNDGEKVSDLRVVVVGCSGKYKRLHQVEESLIGRLGEEIESISVSRIPFTGKKFMSSEYLEHCAQVELERRLLALLKGEIFHG
jgi:CO/xanthine dehydrogenase FAD-binding subunit